MRISTRLRLTSTVTIAAFVVLAPVLTWSYLEYKKAKSDYAITDTIQDNAFERTSFRDQYFLYREDRARVQWDEHKDAVDQLLDQAEILFQHEANLNALERLRRNIDDSAAIFHRIVNNTDALKKAAGNRHVYEELDKRLASQLLLKDATIRDITSTLHELSAQRVKQTYKYLIIIVGLFAVTLALATILTSIQLGRLIRRRLVPLHDGAKIVADGNLDYRILCEGTDEFAELALSVNAMTDSLQASNKQLETEIIAHQQTEESLRVSENQLRLLLDSTAEAIYGIDMQGNCTFCNPSCLRMLGYRHVDQLIGKNMHELIHYRYSDGTLYPVKDCRIYRAFLVGESSHVSDEVLWRADGTCFSAEYWSYPQRLDGIMVGAVVSFMDITERKQIEDKLARAHAELQQFTYVAAHHLQEPARRLVSFVQRLQAYASAEQLNEDATAALHFIEQSAARQSALVRDIQLYLAADQPRSTVENIAVADVITNLLQHRASLLCETGAQVDYKDIGSVYIDRPRLKDIFGILLDNSLCYRHPKLTPHIRITAELKMGRVIYRVADNGIGIPAEYRERVFGVFERLQVHDNQNSTGIGLAIVRRIIESCGGSVLLQETPGGGTTVLFDLPG